jgi:uncharacterized protein YgiM (DUF1202 family)
LGRTVALAALTALTIACREEVPDVPPMREAVAIEYVAVDETIVRQAPNESAPELLRIRNSEPVSVLAYQDPWAEVRTGTGSGWVKRSDLASEKKSATLESTRDNPRFRRAPMPVSSPGNIDGEIVLEANVNDQGQITSIKTISNTTGSAELEARNTSEFRKASFYPMVVYGKKKPFIYYHRIEY